MLQARQSRPVDPISIRPVGNDVSLPPVGPECGRHLAEPPAALGEAVDEEDGEARGVA